MISLVIDFDPATGNCQLRDCPLAPIDVLGIFISLQVPLLRQIQAQIPKVVPVAPAHNGARILDINRLREPKPE